MTDDPYSKPAFGYRNKLARVAWSFVYVIFFRFSPRPMFAWRRMLLTIFGAKIGKGTAIYPSAKIWAPWNLVCEDMVAVANGVDIYNPSLVVLRSHSIVSQDAFLCGASHDYDSIEFQLYSKKIEIGAYAWVCARASVMPGVSLGNGAVLALASVATHDLAPWRIYAGSPAKEIKTRKCFDRI